MATELLLAGVLIGSLTLEGYIFLRVFSKTLEFLKENMQVGGTPISIVKEHAAQTTLQQEAEIARREELRAYKRASLSD